MTDSIYIHDSVIIREGPDTMWLERWRTCWRERIVHDTVREHTTDTVIMTVEVEKESPALAGTPMKRGTRTPGWAWAMAVALAGCLIAQIIRVKNRLNKL